MGVFGLSAKTYNRNHLLDTAVTPESSDRLWWFQVCTEVAYFQVAPANDSIRSQLINTEYMLHYHHQTFKYHFSLPSCLQMLFSHTFIGIIWTYARLCLGKVFTLKSMQQTCTMEEIELLVCNIQKLLGAPLSLLHVPTVSSRLLILNFAATKIIFTNGSQDPWRHASKQTSSPDRKFPFTLIKTL